MKNALLRIVAAAVVLGSVTCGCQEGEKALAVVTYNTGLAPTVPDYSARRPNVITALRRKKNNFDFVCLQEVWFESDMQDILDKMGKSMQHHFSAIHQAPDTLRNATSDLAPCTLQEARTLARCVQSKCSSPTPTEEKICVVNKCRDQIYGVTQTCRTCISVAGSDAEVAAKCLNGANRFNTPGLLVLSKQPMSDVMFVDYHNGREVLIQRGYIQAKVEALTLVCTHLTSVFPYFFDVNMTDLYKNYEEMQRAEIDQVWAAFNSINHVLMGDLNTGPARNRSGQPVIKGEATGNYDHLICDLQYVSPYMKNVGLCTYCNSDNNATWEEHKEDAIVDHVLLSKDFHPKSTKSKRTFTRNKGQMSDHYGVKFSMCLS